MEATSTTRRKACHNCVASKRRCRVTLPRCTRCAQKGLECDYDLEPLPNPSNVPYIPRWHGVSEASDVALHCFLERISTRDDQASHASRLRLRPDPTGVAYIVWALSLVPDSAARGALSPFIHPKLQLAAGHFHLAAAVVALRRLGHVSPTDKAFGDLIRADPADAQLEDALDAAQALMLYLISFLSDRRRSHDQGIVASWFAVLSTWVEALQLRAYDKMIEGLSPWQTWILGESTRRTILTSHIFTCIFHSGEYELPSLKLHMESLPFDGRVGLWQAESPQAWISAARAKRGGDVHTQLVSFHEFGTSHPKLPFDADGDTFLAMMLVAHNGIDKMVDD